MNYREKKSRILVVDDEANIRYALKMILEYEGYIFYEAESGLKAMELLEEHPEIDLVLLDVRLPDIDGLRLLADIRKKPFPPEVVMISGHGTIEMAVEATKLGAFDFLEKPPTRDRVLLSIRNALEARRLRTVYHDIKKKTEKSYQIVGEHPLMKNLWQEIMKIAPTTATVLILGESGTGKELVARAIHAHSPRAAENFVQVNCAAIPEELIESELFGHEKGAFTGATERKPGKFELADGGTIFLDEIGDMSLKTQSKVLRVLEEGEVQRVGSSKVIKVDVRIIAATNKDLKKEMKEGRFREDLYFRLNVVPINVPPLRDRKEDIPLLVDYFCARYSEENNFRRKKFSPEALELMMKYPWKGNVRELKNLVERLLILSDGDVIGPEDLPEYIYQEKEVFLPDPRKIKTLKDFREEAEKSFILYKLKVNNWNVSKTAREIDTPRSNLYKKLEQYGIKISAGAGEAVASSSDEEEGEESPNSTGQDGR